MERAQYMTTKQTQQMGRLSRTHANCKSRTGVYRPGKTAKDRANKSA